MQHTVTQEHSAEKTALPNVGSEEDCGMMKSHEQGATEVVRDQSVKGDLPNQRKHQQQVEPVASDFNIPVDIAEEEELITRMVQCGVSYADAVTNIEKRKKSFNQAVKKYISASKTISKRGRQIKSRKNSLNDN